MKETLRSLKNLGTDYRIFTNKVAIVPFMTQLRWGKNPAESFLHSNSEL
jgi:hypothetical protein